MTILSYGIRSAGIIDLWALMVLLSSFGVIASVAYLVIDWFSKPCFFVLLSLIVILTVGILGLCFWTPHYNTIKVYNNESFQIESVMDNYDIIGTDGYIITLQEKEPIN
jgi:tetrahydromethanopterin S-methyltransferase subunit E